MIAQPTSLSNGSHTRWPVLACTTETWLPGQSEISEPQPFDVDGTQTEPADQKDDRVIALPGRVTAIDRLNDLRRHRPDPTPTGSSPACST